MPTQDGVRRKIQPGQVGSLHKVLPVCGGQGRTKHPSAPTAHDVGPRPRKYRPSVAGVGLELNARVLAQRQRLGMGKGRLRRGVQNNLVAGLHEAFHLTSDFQGAAIGGRFQAVHGPDVHGFFSLQPANQTLPRIFFMVPMVAVGRLLCGLNSVTVHFGLEELVCGAQNRFRRRFVNHPTGRAEMCGDFNQVASDDWDARLEVIKEFVGQAPTVVLTFGFIQGKAKVGGFGIAGQGLARYAANEADFGSRPALGFGRALKVRKGVAGTHDE